jgi:hypothetical protein
LAGPGRGNLGKARPVLRAMGEGDRAWSRRAQRRKGARSMRRISIYSMPDGLPGGATRGFWGSLAAAAGIWRRLGGNRIEDTEKRIQGRGELRFASYGAGRMAKRKGRRAMRSAEFGIRNGRSRDARGGRGRSGEGGGALGVGELLLATMVAAGFDQVAGGG